MADLHQSLQEAPEKEDIRMLGRMLGDVIREKEGEEIFNLVEKIRRTAVSFRRNPNLYSADTLNNLLKNLSRNHAIQSSEPFPTFPILRTSQSTSMPILHTELPESQVKHLKKAA